MDAGTVVFIGPIGSGKSTVGKLLAEALGRPFVDVDDLRADYYVAEGYSIEAGMALAEEHGMDALLAHWKPYEASAVERVVVEHAGSVIAFGAGHSVHDDPALAARVRQALHGIRPVVLLIPSLDPDRSIQVLRDRNDLPVSGHDTNDGFVRHPANHALATHVITTDGKSPEQVVVEVKRVASLH